MNLKQVNTFRWPEGKRAALSLSFDDARPTQLDYGLPVLDKYDVKATFYISVDPMKQWLGDWISASENGHEIGNHSLTHPCSGNFPFARNNALENYTLDGMCHELDEANDIIKSLIGVTPTTFAYPCGQKFVGRGRAVKSYVPLVAERFVAGRGWLDKAPNDPTMCDLAQVLAVEIDGLDFEETKKPIDAATERGAWLVFAGHDIADEEKRQTTLTSTLKAICQYARDPKNGIWIATVGTVAEYIQQLRTNDDEEKPITVKSK